MNRKIYLCEDSIDGIFTAIYMAWSSGYGHDNVKIEEIHNQSYNNVELFSDYINVNTDYNLASKVSKAVKLKISEDVYHIVCRTALSNHVGKADIIYRFLVLGFHIGRNIMDHLGNEVVGIVFKVNRYVSREAQHFLGFVRFSEQEGGLLTSIIHPKNNVLSLIMPHFADRLPNERFIIYDAIRCIASVHIPERQWIMVGLDKFENNEIDITCNEDDYRNLWKIFYKNIAIKERKNLKLQRNNLPLRFCGDMTEFVND